MQSEQVATLRNEQLQSPSALSIDSNSLSDEYAHNPKFQQLQTTLRSLLLIEAQSLNSTEEHTPEPSGSLTVDQSIGLQERIYQNDGPGISQNRLATYFTIWIAECAPWLDMFDEAQNFGTRVTTLAHNSPAVLYALLALSARQAERSRAMNESTMDSLTLYSHAISALSSTLSSREPSIAVAVCILCVLEMMSVSPQNWRRHAMGCATLFQAMRVHGFSGGLLQAVFWCYARMDLVSVIVADGTEGTVLPIDQWVMLDQTSQILSNSSYRNRAISEAFLTQGQSTPDMHANYAVYLTARTYDLLASRTRFLELGEENGYKKEAFEYLWLELWDRLQEWYHKRPTALLPIKAVYPAKADHGFPQILYAHWAAISSNQLYHVACIAMLDMMPFGKCVSDVDIWHRPLWHARSIVGISLSNGHKGCLNNAIQPLYIAGRLFTHKEEHLVIGNLLGRIEALTGWGSRWRIRDLEIEWGYRPGELNICTTMDDAHARNRHAP